MELLIGQIISKWSKCDPNNARSRERDRQTILKYALRSDCDRVVGTHE